MFPNSEVVMLPLIVNDVQRAISQNLDFVALPAALTLPDICADVLSCMRVYRKRMFLFVQR